MTKSSRNLSSLCAQTSTVSIKRVYEAPSSNDGYRILVDRLWPRGLTKEAASIDLWLKDVAPSAELRAWFGHEPARWPHFVRRYRLELQAAACPREAFDHMCKLAGERTVTLVYGAKNEAHNNAVALKQILAEVGHTASDNK